MLNFPRCEYRAIKCYLDFQQTCNFVEQNITNTISPWLSVADSATAVAFYKAAFGAKELYLLETPDGAIAELSIGGATFWVSTDPGLSGGSPKDISSSARARFVLTANNPEEIVASAISAGAIEVYPVGEDHGWKLGRITDPFGFDWEVGHRVS